LSTAFIRGGYYCLSFLKPRDSRLADGFDFLVGLRQIIRGAQRVAKVQIS
jgi:hypothetical protein